MNCCFPDLVLCREVLFQAFYLHGVCSCGDRKWGWPYGSCYWCWTNKVLLTQCTKGHYSINTAVRSCSHFFESNSSIHPSVVVDALPVTFQYYSGGVYNDYNCRSNSLNHAMLLVGYGVDAETGYDYWLLKNRLLTCPKYFCIYHSYTLILQLGEWLGNRWLYDGCSQ